VEKIYDRDYFIFVTDIYDTTKSQYSKKVFATTSIEGNEIEFRYELLTRKMDSINKYFIRNSLELLRTIKIKRGR
ncbi:MAG: hypothetical protein JWN83_2037, partial [Chitinophagaceae bacterium]|nr:hypothetical protein [Chitinophagaceae bacterium]